MRYLGLIPLLLLPHLSLAAVLISEIAWMGSSQSANHEWIELYNSGPTVSVDGWMLHDANNLTIDLTGTIAGGSRVVLERTSEESAPGPAFLLYTGALTNTGATLVLRDAAGEVVDQVTGGDGWTTIGGDNDTKATAQLQNGVWVTKVATPGSAPNPVTPVEDTDPDPAQEPEAAAENQSSPTTEATRSSGGGSPATVLTLPDITLQLAIDAPANVHVGQPFALSVTPSGVGDTIADSLVYQWSLGNGQERAGQDIEYMFEYPGQYVIVVSGAYKRQTQFARHTITVLPVELKLTKSTDGTSYVLHNQSDAEIDVGGYRLVGTSQHTLPKHTIVLPQSKITIPLQLTDQWQAVTALYDQTGSAVAMHLPGYISPAAISPASDPPSRPLAVASLPPTPSPAPSTQFGFASDVATPPPPAPAQPVALIPTAQAAEGSTDTNTQPHNWPVYGLGALLLFGTLGIYLVPQKRDDPPWV